MKENRGEMNQESLQQRTKRSGWRSLSWYGVVLTILFSAVTYVATEFHKHPFKVMGGDGLSYYAYLPLTLNYQDLKMEFYSQGEDDIVTKSRFGGFPKPTPNGNWVIPTSMGLALLASPFVVAGHLFALMTPFENSGYSAPYMVGVLLSTLFYLGLGLIFLRKVLLSCFNETITLITLLCLVFGTNLLYYIINQPFMSHVYSFSLISVFLFLTVSWHRKQKTWILLLLGFTLGLISLVRPVNVIIVVLFFLWNVRSFRNLRDKFIFWLKKPQLILFMVLPFLVVWLPQMLYWKHVTDQYFYWSYSTQSGEKVGFFFGNPQILNVLFSYRKGWLLYTPIMIFALTGMLLMKKKSGEFQTGTIATFLLFLYITSSWWSWWYGCSFGQRPFVDIYGLLAVPFASALFTLSGSGKKVRIAGYSILSFFVFLNLFQTWQISHYLLDPIKMTGKSYWYHFLRTSPDPRYYDALVFPDYYNAVRGKYYTEYEITDKERKEIERKKLNSKSDYVEQIRMEIYRDGGWLNHIREKAKKYGIPLEEMINKDIEWYYNNNVLPGLREKDPIKYYSLMIRDDPDYYNFVEEKARKRGIPVEEMIEQEAQWIIKKDSSDHQSDSAVYFKSF